MVEPRRTIAWVALYLALTLDVAQVFALDASGGFTDPLLVGLAVGGFVGELVLFAVALREIPPTAAYGLLGLSTAVVSVISIGWLGEPITVVKAVALVAVIGGAVLLDLDARATSA